MRISDWSSDVCSSDLSEDRAIGVGDVLKRGTTEDALAERGDHRAALHDRAHFHAAGRATILLDHDTVLRHVDKAAGQITRVRRLERRVGQALRSEEHTSELQSLMRTSYAVFCLQKKT